MKSDPKVSIIIPVFNAASTLARAIESASGQHYRNLEIILVDGGSTDGSVEITAEYRQRIAHVISEKDNGVYDAINKGIRLSSGDWIYILGADDYLADPSVLDKIFRNRYGDEKILYGKIENENSMHRAIPSIHLSRFDRSLFWRNTLHQQSVFYHKSLFNEDNFDTDYKVLSDYDFHLWLLAQLTKAEYVDVLIAKCSAQGLSKNFHWPLYAEELRIKRQRMDTFRWLLNIPWVMMKFIYKKIR